MGLDDLLRYAFARFIVPGTLAALEAFCPPRRVVSFAGGTPASLAWLLDLKGFTCLKRGCDGD